MDQARGSFFRQEHSAYRTALVYALEIVPPYRVRVRFPERDNVISWWLPVLVPKVQNDKFFWQPDIGEQVAVLMDVNDEDGLVLGSVASNVDQAPSGLGPNNCYIGFQDGTVIQYNRQTHQLQITLGAGGMVQITTASGGSLELDPAGNVEVQAVTSISLTQGMAPALDALALVSKLVDAFNLHTHGDPQGGNTGTPTVPWIPSDVASTLVKASN